MKYSRRAFIGFTIGAVAAIACAAPGNDSANPAAPRRPKATPTPKATATAKPTARAFGTSFSKAFK